MENGMIKNADKRLKKLGFTKIEENRYVVIYERENATYGYTHEVDIIHKYNKENIVISSVKGLNSDGFNNAVGLTANEMKFFRKKMIEKWGKHGRR